MGPGPKAGETVFGGFWSALDAGTGQVLWENAGSNGPVDNPYFPPYPSGTIATNQGPVTVANGVVYAGAMDAAGTMYAFDATTGNILWSFESGGSVLSGAAVVDGVVYWGSGYSNNFFGTPNNKLFAFSLSSLNKAGVEETNNTAATPTQFSLEQNYPNPFNPTTQIRFSMPEAAHVTLKVYDTIGQLVKTLVDGSMSAGVHQVTWDATDNNGNSLAGGVYFYKLTAGTFTQVHKMLLLK
jgi:polyvinyl alcohol dehydrogenase (cytochrome)